MKHPRRAWTSPVSRPSEGSPKSQHRVVRAVGESDLGRLRSELELSLVV
jgi:hypothetical protein